MPEGSCIDNKGRQLLLDILRKRKLELENRLIRDVYDRQAEKRMGDELFEIEVLRTWVENVPPCTF